jgi:hypothetical protein
VVSFTIDSVRTLVGAGEVRASFCQSEAFEVTFSESVVKARILARGTPRSRVHSVRSRCLFSRSPENPRMRARL